jgi:hypothetical protein
MGAASSAIQKRNSYLFQKLDKSQKGFLSEADIKEWLQGALFKLSLSDSQLLFR